MADMTIVNMWSSESEPVRDRKVNCSQCGIRPRSKDHGWCNTCRTYKDQIAEDVRELHESWAKLHRSVLHTETGNLSKDSVVKNIQEFLDLIKQFNEDERRGWAARDVTTYTPTFKL